MCYSITKVDGSLIATSEERLNLEPKDWRKDFKSELTNAIKALSPNGKYLKARLLTREKDFFDVENILFYNLGTANFKKLDSKGIWFSLEREESCHNKKYVHEYCLIDLFPEPSGDIIAEWSNIIIEKPTTSKKPLDYWLPIKQSTNFKTYFTNYCGEFGLNIEIGTPKNEVINIINIQKPLLDGLISVFHKATNVSKEAIEYMATKTNHSIEEIQCIINNNKVTVLPQRDIIQKYREGIKWNPQDEKCTDVRIIIRETDDKNYKISGYMFKRE
jgi:hypothetical protein